MRNTKGTIVAEGPDVVGCWTKIVGIAITPAHVFICCMNGFRPSVQLIETALGADIALPRELAISARAWR